MDHIDKILYLLKKEKKTQKALAEFIDMSPPTLNKILRRDKTANRKLSAEHIFKIAEFFKIDESFFSGSNKKPVKKIPIIGTSSCGGADINHLQVEGDYCLFSAENYHDKLFCVIANGDSMAPEIEDGDQVICDPTIKPTHGDLAYYKYNGESAIKVYVENKDGGIVMLKPINQNYKFKTTIFRIDEEEIERVEFAKVVGINKTNFKNKAARLKLVGEQ